MTTEARVCDVGDAAQVAAMVEACHRPIETAAAPDGDRLPIGLQLPTFD
ncbi:MAG: hypothetical protein ACYCW6_28270 [Candidatus Xenobia bacterium]